MKPATLLMAATLVALGCSGSPTRPISREDTNALLALHERLPVGSQYFQVRGVLREVSAIEPDPCREGVASATAQVSLFGVPSTVAFQFEQGELIAIGYHVAGLPDVSSLEPISSSVDEFYDARLPREGCGNCWVVFLTGIVVYSVEDTTWGVSWVITSGELASRLRDALDAPGGGSNRILGRRDSAPARPGQPSG
jgi:hypothetical protein